jgi:hypothetical protein
MGKLDLLKKYISIQEEDFELWGSPKNSHEKYLRNELHKVAFLIQDMPEEDIEEAIEHYKLMIIARSIDLLNNINIVCIPERLAASPPFGEEDCLIEKCPECHQDMWVSKLKREKRENNKHVKFYCLECIVSATQSGFSTKDFEGMHLSKMQ